MMHQRKVKAGQTIYRESDASDAVHFISVGQVEVMRRSGQQQVVLGVLKDGQIFGEMGVLQDKPRSTTTRALTEVSMVSVSKDEFLKAFGEADSITLPLLRMLCERLRAVDGQVIEHLNPERARALAVSRILLLPDSREMEIQIGSAGIVLEGLPYTVGRRAHKDDSPQASPTSLLLRPYETYGIDREHFAIEKHDGHIYVRDLASHLGTSVNDRRIANFESNHRAELGFGVNTVLAGGARSPYRFHIVVERA